MTSWCPLIPGLPANGKFHTITNVQKDGTTRHFRCQKIGKSNP